MYFYSNQKAVKDMNINNILITGRIYKEIQAILAEKNLKKNFRILSDEEVTINDLQWADAFASFKPSPIFDLTHIKWVHSFGAGVDSFLHKREWNDEVLLTRTICSFGQKIGEYCLSYILRDLQLHHQFENQQNKREWNPIAPKQLHEQKVVIYGTGVIGQEVSKLLHSLGMTVYGVSLSGQQKSSFKKVFTLTDVTQTLNEANFVISTLPLTDRTFNLFNEKIFSAMDGGVFINVGRGSTVDEKSLLNALQHGNVKNAVLDVFQDEPLPLSSPMWEQKDITITPHISAITSPEEAVECFIETLMNIEANLLLKNQVNIHKGF
jgi:phosphoglycerate dehydrogenase-like enzyme